MLPSSSGYPKIPPNLKGVKHSRTSNTTSLGLECLDKLIEGDGIPFPSVILVDEKCDRKVGKILQRIYAAEGIIQEQNVIVASPRKQDLEDLLNSIPSESTGTSAAASSQKNAPEESLKIAWRFQSAPQINSSVSSSKPKFDLAKSRARMEVNESIQTIYANTYDQLWKELKNILDSPAVDITQSGPKSPTRIVLSELGSPLFLDHFVPAITKFITNLRAYIMSSCAVVMLIIDGPHMDNKLVQMFHIISDTVLNFYPTDEVFSPGDPFAYSGRLEIAKIPRLYGTTPFRPEFCDYTYKDTRHTMEIRKLHLNFDDSSSNELDKKALEPITDDLREMGILAPVGDED